MEERTMTGKTLGRVRDLSQEGQGIVGLESADQDIDGRVAFIPGLIPGDVIEVDELWTRGRKVRVDAFSLIEASPDRQEIFCPHFPECGGCQVQELTYEASVDWKTKRVRDTLERVAKLEKVDDLVMPCIAMEEPYGFRSIVQLRPDNYGQLGFFQASSTKVVAQETCDIMSADFNLIRDNLNYLLAQIDSSEVAKLQLIELRQNKDGSHFMIFLKFFEPIIDQDWELFFDELINSMESQFGEDSFSLWLEEPDYLLPIYGEKKLITEENGVELRFSVKSFMQTNRWQNEVLYQKGVDFAQEALADAYANASEEDSVRILELFCGVGSLSLHLAKALPEAKILGIEVNPDAVMDARDNAALNWVPEEQALFKKADATHFFTQVGEAQAPEEPTNYDLLVVDPPRQGLDKELCEAILASEIPHLLYVSCDPTSLARDIKILKENYQVKRVQPIDMFPWTTHVELVALMSRVDE